MQRAARNHEKTCEEEERSAERRKKGEAVFGQWRRQRDEEIAITVIACLLHAALVRGVNQSEQCNSDSACGVKIGWNPQLTPQTHNVKVNGLENTCII